jgi:hypothetical protein
LLACGVLLLTSVRTQAQPPTGAWKINANGAEGELVIESITDGKVEGKMLGERIRGFYDEKTKCLSVLRVGGDGIGYQAYKGYLFINPEEKQIRYHFAGTFQVFSGEGSAGAEYGWYAQVTKPK